MMVLQLDRLETGASPSRHTPYSAHVMRMTVMMMQDGPGQGGPVTPSSKPSAAAAGKGYKGVRMCVLVCACVRACMLAPATFRCCIGVLAQLG